MIENTILFILLIPILILAILYIGGSLYELIWGDFDLFLIIPLVLGIGLLYVVIKYVFLEGDESG